MGASVWCARSIVRCVLPAMPIDVSTMVDLVHAPDAFVLSRSFLLICLQVKDPLCCASLVLYFILYICCSQIQMSVTHAEDEARMALLSMRPPSPFEHTAAGCYVVVAITGLCVDYTARYQWAWTIVTAAWFIVHGMFFVLSESPRSIYSFAMMCVLALSLLVETIATTSDQGTVHMIGVSLGMSYGILGLVSIGFHSTYSAHDKIAQQGYRSTLHTSTRAVAPMPPPPPPPSSVPHPGRHHSMAIMRPPLPSRLSRPRQSGAAAVAAESASVSIEPDSSAGADSRNIEQSEAKS
jgi:hypothetical protein